MVFVPLGGSVKWTVLSTILYPPENNLLVAPAEWLVAAEPIDPLSTTNKLTEPVSVIGPTDVVPKPTLVIFINSSSTLITSPEVIDDKPVTLNVVAESVTLNSKSVVIGVNAIGDWITPSIERSAFSFFLNISNSWAFPTPTPVKVIPIPARASGRDFEILNVSLLTLIAYTSDPSVPPAVAIPDKETPVNVEPGL